MSEQFIVLIWFVGLVVALVVLGATIGAVVGAVSGAISGIIQRLILRRQITWGTKWMLVSIVSLAVGLVVGTAVVGTPTVWVAVTIMRNAGNALTPSPDGAGYAGLALAFIMLVFVVGLTVIGMAGGVANKIIQWLILQRQVSRRFGWWLLVSIIGWVAGLIINGVVVGAVGWNWTTILVREAETGSLQRMLPSFLVAMVVFGTTDLIITWTVSGAITGIALIALNWLWQRFRDRGLGRIRSQRVRVQRRP